MFRFVDQIGFKKDPISLLAHVKLLREFWRTRPEIKIIFKMHSCEFLMNAI